MLSAILQDATVPSLSGHLSSSTGLLKMQLNTTLDMPLLDNSVLNLAEHTGKAIRSHLSTVGYSLERPIPPYPHVLDTAVHATISSWRPAIDLPISRVAPVVAGTAMSYSYASIGLQEYIAIYTILFFALDDFAERFPSPSLSAAVLSAARPRWDTSVRDIIDDIEQPVLARFVQYALEETPKYFSAYSAASIINASSDFLLGLAIEIQGAGMRVGAGAAAGMFPSWLRSKTGIAEPYVHFIFAAEDVGLERYVAAIPDMEQVIEHTNDVLSFYKEAVVGQEKGTYLQLQAEAWGVGLGDALHRCCKETADGDRRVQALLKVVDVDGLIEEDDRASGRLVQLWRSFLDGYTMFHVSQQRYRLKELGIGHWDGTEEERG